uniref:Uncharacterized protein n=1 Tax=Arion vulgaris TaxID=1028688 RepID=A0A0B7BVV0_9EUPU
MLKNKCCFPVCSFHMCMPEFDGHTELVPDLVKQLRNICNAYFHGDKIDKTTIKIHVQQ